MQSAQVDQRFARAGKLLGGVRSSTQGSARADWPMGGLARANLEVGSSQLTSGWVRSSTQGFAQADCSRNSSFVHLGSFLASLQAPIKPLLGQIINGVRAFSKLQLLLQQHSTKAIKSHSFPTSFITRTPTIHGNPHVPKTSFYKL